MADGIRIRTLLSPGVPRGLRAEMFKHQQDLDAVAQDLQAARDMVEAGDLQGATADRLFDAMTDNTDNAKTLADAVKALVEALGALADALTSTGLWFDNLADAAVAEHLEVTEDEIVAPPTPRTPLTTPKWRHTPSSARSPTRSTRRSARPTRTLNQPARASQDHSHGWRARSCPMGRGGISRSGTV